MDDCTEFGSKPISDGMDAKMVERIDDLSFGKIVELMISVDPTFKL
jgi:hypothetical protein